MSMLALISTMGSKNKGNIMKKLEDVSKLIVNGNKTQYLSLYHVTKNRANQKTGNSKALVYSTILQAPNLPIVHCTYICSIDLCRSLCLL